MLENSDCHTLDRDSYVAQLDCNRERDVLPDATTKHFEINHWPYMHDSGVRSCMETISSQSWKNIELRIGARYLEGALYLVTASLALLTIIN